MKRFTLLVLFALSACDPAQCPQISGPFGPCIPGYSACADGSTCLSTEVGDMCLPSSAEGAPPVGYEACAMTLGKRLSCTAGGDCRILCDVDAECGGGTTCSKAGACVWPYPPAAETTGTSEVGDVSSSPLPMTGSSTVETSTG
jgi:hypothetical protein